MTIAAHAPSSSLLVHGTPVELVDVVKAYPGAAHRALDGVSLTVRAGELVALLGPSGCGKTTALRAISGLEHIDAGHIRVGGEEIEHVPVHRRDIGMVFQSYSLFPHMTVAQNVAFGLEMRRVRGAERRERTDGALELVGLADLGRRYAHQLSGGQQQRVALARALVTRPRVLLLDEPLSALDAKVRVQLRDEIRRIQQETGITAVFVTHDQEEALAVADRIAVMNDGRSEQIGTPEDLYLRPATPFVAGFVGVSNRLAGELVQGRVRLLGIEVPALAGTDDGPVTAFLRPEDLRLAEEGVPGVVVSSSFLGAIRRTAVRLDDDLIVTVQHGLDLHPRAGDAVHVQATGRAVALEGRTG